jgi:uncharacterized membrane protein
MSVSSRGLLPQARVQPACHALLARRLHLSVSQQPIANPEEEFEMSTVEKSVDVNVPVSTAYNQWTQFEEFPRFMEGVKSVTQTDDTHLRWVAEIGGKEKEWDAEISEQSPDQRIAWHSTSGARNAGVVTFHRLDDNTTRVTLQMDVDPEGIVENVGDFLGVLDGRVEGDMERFKEFIESRGSESGAWRGEVEAPTGSR